jgi:hypothetical protein
MNFFLLLLNDLFTRDAVSFVAPRLALLGNQTSMSDQHCTSSGKMRCRAAKLQPRLPRQPQVKFLRRQWCDGCRADPRFQRLIAELHLGD